MVMSAVALAVLVFAGAALVTVVGSIRLAGLGDSLADRTGWSVLGTPSPRVILRDRNEM